MAHSSCLRTLIHRPNYKKNGSIHSWSCLFTVVWCRSYSFVQKGTEQHAFGHRSHIPREQNVKNCANSSLESRVTRLPQVQTRLFHDKSVGTAPGSAQSVEDVCRTWAQVLDRQNVPEPRASVEYFVAFVLGMKTLYGVDRTTQLTSEQLHRVHEMCQQRLQHWPVQYILGEWDFGDLVLKMRPPVFIPRPETEELVGMVAKCMEKRNLHGGRILEVCCGSGAISLSLLHKFPQMSAISVDISPDACSLTIENARHTGLATRLTVLQEDITSPKALAAIKKFSPFDLLISNPPYIPSGDLPSLERQILEFEDMRALDGGSDGLDIVRLILNLSPHLLVPHSDVWLEVNPGHPDDIHTIVASSPQLGLEFVASHSDYLGRERFCHLCNACDTASTNSR